VPTAWWFRAATDESWAVSADERLRLFTLALQTVGKQVPIIVDTGGIATEAVIDLSVRVKEAGAAGVMEGQPRPSTPSFRRHG